MRTKKQLLFICLLCFCFLLPHAQAQDTLATKPDTISFKSGNLTLKGLLWKPEGKGPFPAILFNHGSEPTSYHYLPRVAKFFVDNGYAFFTPFRRGQSLSKGQGKHITELMDSVIKKYAQDSVTGKKMLAMLTTNLHETEQLQDQMSGLQALKKIKSIDSKRIAVAGISFGGIQTMVMATKKTGIKAAVNFAGAAMMWNNGPEVQEWMKSLAAKATVPVYFIQAENDFSIEPSLQLSDVMKKEGKRYEVKIYPRYGTTQRDGHRFVNAGEVWGSEVFAFLKKYLK